MLNQPLPTSLSDVRIAARRVEIHVSFKNKATYKINNTQSLVIFTHILDEYWVSSPNRKQVIFH